MKLVNNSTFDECIYQFDDHLKKWLSTSDDDICAYHAEKEFAFLHVEYQFL
jgi:hypothetical protein